MAESDRLQWLSQLSKLPPKKQILILKGEKASLFNDLQRLFKKVSRTKTSKTTPKQRHLFKKHKNFLKKFVKSQGLKKIRTLILKRQTKGGFPFLALLPAIVSLASSIIPQLF